MFLTRLFVRQPSLVVVACALVLIAGVIAVMGLVQQNFPNVDFPVVQVQLSYPGASTTEIRDAIVKPVEDAIAGAPDLDHIATQIEQGQATVTATFTLGSSQTSDLVEVQRRVQSTRSQLPTDLSAPKVRTFDPSQATIATLAVTSPSLNAAQLSAVVTNEIVPEIEPVDGVANVNANGTVTPAIEVEADPAKLDAERFTLGDIVSAISGNNVRAPGGIAYGPSRETSIDVRGDVTDPQTVANLPLFQSALGSTGAASLTGPQGGTGLQSPANGGSTGSAATSSAVAGGSGVAVAAAAPASIAVAGTTGLATSTTISGSTAASASNSAATNASAASSTANTATAIGQPVATAATSATSPSGSNAGGSSSATTGTVTILAGSSAAGTAVRGTSATSTTASATTGSSTAGSTTSGLGTTGSAASGTVITTTIASTRSSATGVLSAATPGPFAVTVPIALGSSASPAPTASPAFGTSDASGGTLGSAVPNATATSASASANAGSAGSAGSSGSSGSADAAASGASASSGIGSSALNAWSVASRALRIGDVAHVYAGAEPKRTYSYVGTAQTINLAVQKATGASEVQASHNLIAALPAIEKHYPNVQIRVLRVQATFTQQQLDSVYHSLAEGIFSTGVVMLFFLRSWRNAIVVLIAIPTSLLVTLFVMRLANFTIDTISLLAMTLVIGILVDDSIVVLENTGRHFEDGEAPQTAAILGRQEIGAAALIITLVDVVVFLPIAFLPGTVGKFLAEFGLVVVVATLTSLAVSFTITPALAGNWSLLSTWRPPWIVNIFTNAFMAARRLYVEHVLEFALRFKFLVVGAAFLATAGAIALVPLGYVGFEFIPAVDRGEIFLQLTFPSGTPLTTTNAAVARLSQQIEKYPDVQHLVGTAGSYQSGFGGGLVEGAVGQIHVFLNDHPKKSTTQYVAILNKLARTEYPLAKPVAIPATGSGGGNAQPLDFNIVSADDEPEKYAPAVLAAMRATPGSQNANDSVSKLDPQVDVEFDRERARALNIDIATAANAVRSAFGGSLAAQFETTRGIEYVQVLYPRSAQTSTAALLHIPIRTRSGNLAYVGDVAHLVENPNSPLMSRVNRQTVVHVSSNVAPGAVLSNVQKGFLARVASLGLPEGVRVVPNAGGNAQDLADTVKGLGSALVLSFALVYLLMVALYDSYRLPFIIMFAIPVAAVGALGSLALTGQSLNFFSLIGTVLLVGLVSKNGILLVDFANHRIRQGIDRTTAIRESAQERFRPIVMTTFSMIAGMAPIALAIDPGSATRRSLGIVVIGGLLSSLVLTLVVVPIAFVWFAPRHPHRDVPTAAEAATVGELAGARA